MDEIIADILAHLRAHGELGEKALKGILHARDRLLPPGAPRFSKKALLPYYLGVKAHDPARWERWEVDPALERRLVAALRMKPRRTASGVATITVITKPGPCSSACLYCPNDVRMPKSYLADEPACQRAERACFDPYVQVATRLQALAQMGHPTDKVELIVLGGTWSDYPESYRVWFVTELFRALNEGVRADGTFAPEGVEARRARYRAVGVLADEEELVRATASVQARVDAGALTYNEACRALYDKSPAWRQAASWQRASWEDLARAQRANEDARHRVVGLVVETRPDRITAADLAGIRRLGCTKVQMGVQTLDARLVALNRRGAGAPEVARAFALARLFGFKIHAHFMANLLGAEPAGDKRDYARLVTDPAFLPDEVKLYPCALVGGTGLVGEFDAGRWRPYTEDELLDVLTADVLATPPYVRISRMIRDISSADILAGNKKTNLRQMVDQRLAALGARPGLAAAGGVGGAVACPDGARGAAADPPLAAPEKKGGLATGAAADASAAGAALAPGGQERAARAAGSARPLRVQEIRAREIVREQVDVDALALDDYVYETSVSTEHFLQWVTDEGRIAGFLRLSLPRAERVRAALDGAAGEPGAEAAAGGAGAAGVAAAPAPGAVAAAAGGRADVGADEGDAALFARLGLPVRPDEAMIREVHVYGAVAHLNQTGSGVQHLGLGRRLVERACAVARAAGYARVNVISSVGTRNYYRGLGFADAGLYQQREL